MDWVLEKVVAKYLLVTSRSLSDKAVLFTELEEVLVMALRAQHEEAKPLEVKVPCSSCKLQLFGGFLNNTV